MEIVMEFQVVPGTDETDIMKNGSFWSVAAFRLKLWAIIYPGIIFLQGLGTLAFFIFGLIAVKSGAISDPTHTVWRRARRWPLIIGLPLSAFGAWLAVQATSGVSGEYMLASAVIFIAAPLSTFGYLGLIAKWASSKGGALRTFMARGGTATLTAYLLQSVILSVLFCGYGFGLYQTLGAAHAIAIAALTGIATLTFTSLWRLKFSRGPMEVLLRRWTYLGDR